MRSVSVFGLVYMMLAAFFLSPAFAGSIEVSDAVARYQDDNLNGVRYQVGLTMVNAGDRHDRLYAARSPIAKRAMISLSDKSRDHAAAGHSSNETHLRTTAVELPVGATVTLSGNGSHIMLMNPTKKLNEGDSFTLTLFFEKAGRMNVDVTIVGTGMQMEHSGAGG